MKSDALSSMKRRRFLQGVAGAALAAPFLPSLERTARGATAAAPRRLVIFYTQNGCLTNRWFPSVEAGAITADSLTGKTLAPLADVANKLLFPRGLAMFPTGKINGYFDPHDQGMGSKLTAAPLDPVEGGSHWAQGTSMDWVLAGLVNPGTKSPLVLSVGSSFKNVKGIISYQSANTPYSPETNPKNVYTTLTGLFNTGGTTTAADYKALQGSTILDCVKGDLTTLRNMNMSKADKQKLSDWSDLMQDTSKKVVTTAACNASNAGNLGITDAAIKSAMARDTATAFKTGGDMMINLIALTMMCDANRVIVLQWPGFVTFTWDGMSHTSDHHGLSHRNGSVAVGGTCAENVIENIGQIDTWYAGRYSKLVHLINQIDEGDRKMLDNSAVMWLPELADGNAHNNNNLPIVIAGSAGGYLKQGVSVVVDPKATKAIGTGNSEASCANGNTSVGFNTGSSGGTVPLNKLHVTLMNAIGAANPAWTPVTTFGVMDTNDVTKGITSPGELDTIKA
jgi:hypothetical protein